MEGPEDDQWNLASRHSLVEVHLRIACFELGSQLVQHVGLRPMGIDRALDARHFDDSSGLALKIEPPVWRSVATGARRRHHQRVSMLHVGKRRRPFPPRSAAYRREKDHPAAEETTPDITSTGTEETEMDSRQHLDGGTHR